MEEQLKNRPIAVQVSGVKKMYKLGQIGGGTLQADLQSWWARKRGKDDPNAKIGADQRSNGKTFMALNGVDLTIYQGEAVGIIGSNGAGKSTLLKLLSKVTAPTEGEIDIYGRIASMLEVGTGFNGELTGRENVYMNGAILGMTKAEIDSKMEQIIEFSEVREFIDTPVKRYSSGMFVKLAFSVAAHLDSEIMIMDEVLAVGDVNFQQKCLKKMRSAAAESGRTVLYVSHNMSTIKTLCDRCIVMESGKIIFEGAVDEAINVYSKTKKRKKLLNYDYSKRKREFKVTNKLSIESAALQYYELDMFKPLVFTLNINSIERTNNLMLRFVLFNSVGTTIGTTYSNRFSAKKTRNVIRFMFSTQNVAPGDYYVDLILCEFDNNMQLRHDIINHAFDFSITESKILYNMKWNSFGWGNVYFDEIEVLNDGQT